MNTAMKLPPIENSKKELFNVKIHPRVIERIRVICHRKSVKRQKLYSNGQLIEALVMGLRLPPAPDPKAEAEYIEMREKAKADRLKYKKKG